MATKNSASDAKRLIDIALAAELFHDSNGRTYATYRANPQYQETWALQSSEFKAHLHRIFYTDTDRTPADGIVQQALCTLQGKALHDGPERNVHVRLAEHEGSIWYDLCTPDWQIAHITTDAIQLCKYDECPVRFRRPKGALPLVLPQKPAPGEPYPLFELWGFMNIGTSDNWVMMMSWLLACLHPTGPYPILVVQGPAGSTKSCTMRYLRALVDPNVAPLRSPFRSDQELMIAACNSRVVAIDNLSSLTVAQSDALCRLATGGGFSSRELYTDGNEFILEASRPVILGGIDDFATRDDLLDRALLVTLPPMNDRERRTEGALDEQFMGMAGRCFWHLLWATQDALLHRYSAHSHGLPRMADFASWIIGAEDRMPWETGGFLVAYDHNRGAAREMGLSSVSIARPLLEYAKAQLSFSMPAEDLLNQLNATADFALRRRNDWPASPLQLGNQIRRASQALKELGCTIQFRRASGRRLITCRYSPTTAA